MLFIAPIPCVSDTVSLILIWLMVFVSLVVRSAVRDVVAFLVDCLLHYTPSERLSIRAASSGRSRLGVISFAIILLHFYVSVLYDGMLSLLLCSNP